MKTHWIWMTLALGGALGAPLLLAVEARPRPCPGPVDPGPFEGPAPDPAEVCATGCAADTHAPTSPTSLGPLEFGRLVDRWLAGQPDALAVEGSSSSAALALDTLLFHREASRSHLLAGRASGLPAEHAAFLAGELDRRHALLSVRLVDGAGNERLRLAPTRMPLGEKQHLLAEDTVDLQAPEVSGTVRRVGLHHLWTRL